MDLGFDVVVTITGIVLVFLILVLLMAIITLEGKIFDGLGKKKVAAKAAASKPAAEYDFSIRETQTYEIIEDVARMRSEIGLLFLNDFNETVLRKILKSNGLEFHLLFVARPHVFISRRHPLADREVITNEELEDYPYLSFEQGEHNSFYFSEEVFSVSERKKNIRVRDRATLFNLLIGLNGYTVCSGVIDENLNGKDIIAVPLADENEMKIGYIVHQKNRISRLGTTYLKALEKYLDPKEEPGRECLHMRQE